MLWDLVRDYFVQHVFGGCDSNGSFFNASWGYGHGGFDDGINCNDIVALNLPSIYDDNAIITIGDYLSTISTIITMVAILLFCVFIIKKIIAIIFRLFTCGSAF